MPDVSANGPTKLNPTISKWVWFSSTDVALKLGEAVCYNFDFIETGVAATDADARRYNHVETPTTLNAQWFAGVAARAYSAKSGGQLIEIYVPGSVCEICLGVATGSTTVGVGILTFDVTATFKGQFRYSGIPGEGSAVPLQETTTGSIQTCLARLQIGPPSGGVEVVQLVDNTAWVAMVGGTTILIGVDCTTGDAEETIVDGTIEGLRKKFEVVGTLVGTNNAKINITGGDGIALAGGALASVSIDAIGDQVALQWIAGAWRTMGGTGIEEA